VTEQQLTVNLGRPELKAKLSRRSRLWRRGMGVLMKHPKFKKAKRFGELPMPVAGIADGWYLRVNGISFRCLQAWVMFPLDGGPPGFRARIDVRFYA
jgi:hypothetical protein